MPLARWKKIVLIGVIAVQLTTATPVAPDRAPAGDAPAFFQTIIQSFGTAAKGGGAEGLLFVIGVLTTMQGGKTFATLWDTPEAVKLRRDLLEKLEAAKGEHEKFRVNYIDYSKQIESLESKNEQLREQLERAERARNVQQVDLLWQQIDRNQASINAKGRKNPAFAMARVLEKMFEADAQLDEQVRELPLAVSRATRNGQHAAVNAINGNGSHSGHRRNGRGRSARKNGRSAKESTGDITSPMKDVETAVAGWARSHHPRYISQWLETPAGRAFADGVGKAWTDAYEIARKHRNQRVARVPKIWNRVVDDYNQGASAEEALPRMELITSKYGPSIREFNLEPENPRHHTTTIDAGSIPERLQKNCDAKVALLVKNVDQLTIQSRKRNVYAKQALTTAALGGGIGATGLTYAGYRYFSGKPLEEVQKEAKAQNRIQDETEITLEAQFKKDREGPDRLKSYREGTASAFLAQQDHLEKILVESFDLRDRNAGKPAYLAERQAKVEKLGPVATRISTETAVERASQEFFTKLNVKSFEKVYAKIYGKDPDSDEGLLRSDLTFIYRDLLLKLYPSIIDNARLDKVEPIIIRPMVDHTLEAIAKDLEDQKNRDEEERKKKDVKANMDAASAPSTISTPAATLPPATTLPSPVSAAEKKPEESSLLTGMPVGAIVQP